MFPYRAAELRPGRLIVAAAGVIRDLAKCEAGRAALLERRQEVAASVLPALAAALNLKAMHQVQQRVLCFQSVVSSMPAADHCSCTWLRTAACKYTTSRAITSASWDKSTPGGYMVCCAAAC